MNSREYAPRKLERLVHALFLFKYPDAVIVRGRLSRCAPCGAYTGVFGVMFNRFFSPLTELLLIASEDGTDVSFRLSGKWHTLTDSETEVFFNGSRI